MKGKILGLDHLGVAVRDPKARLVFWADILGLPLEKVETVATEQVRTWFLDLGGGHLELLEPLSADSNVAKAIEKRGEGIHHLSLRVDDMDAVLARLAARGLTPIGGGARPGAQGARVAFLHPKDTGGVLVELSQRPACPAEETGKPFPAGAVVVLYLKEPRERFVGLLHSIDPAGVALDGIPLEAWEDWIAQWVKGEPGPLAPSWQFFPASRLEKLQLDRDAGELPSMSRQFAERTGKPLSAALRQAQDPGP